MPKYYLDNEYEEPCDCDKRYGKCSCDHQHNSHPIPVNNIEKKKTRQQAEKPLIQYPEVKLVYKPHKANHEQYPCCSSTTSPSKQMPKTKISPSKKMPKTKPAEAKCNNEHKVIVKPDKIPLPTIPPKISQPLNSSSFKQVDAKPKAKPVTLYGTQKSNKADSNMNLFASNQLEQAKVKPAATAVAAAVSNVAVGKRIGNKADMGGQFPCPCVTINATSPYNKEELWDLQFYRWWGSKWLKKKEEILREKLEKDGKRLSDKGASMLKKNSPQDFCNDLCEKKKKQSGWSKIKSMMAAKAMRILENNNGLKKTQPKRCDCNQDTICGPYCLCSHNKICLNPYLENLCPCLDKCFCSEEYHKQKNISPLFYTSNHISSDDSCSCSSPDTELHGVTTEESIEVVPHPIKNMISEHVNCCCSCDEELCACCCCCGTSTMKHQDMQTSQFCLKESFTQTEKQIKKCCRCCRCCNAKGKRNCFNYGDVLNSVDMQRKNAYNNNQHTIKQNSQIKNNTQKQQLKPTAPASFSSNNKTLMVRTNSAQCIPVMENKETCCSSDNQFSCSRMNSFIHHLFGQKYDMPSKIHPEGQFVCNNNKDLHRAHYIPYNIPNKLDSPFLSQNLNQNELKFIRNAHQKNFFLEDGFYSSPVSGRNYDLSISGIGTTIKKVEKKMPDPLGVNDSLETTNLLSHDSPKNPDIEHKKLMTAVCEAILSHRENIFDDKDLTNTNNATDNIQKRFEESFITSKEIFTNRDSFIKNALPLNIISEEKSSVDEYSHQTCEEKKVSLEIVQENNQEKILKTLESQFLKRFENLEEKINNLLCKNNKLTTELREPIIKNESLTTMSTNSSQTGSFENHMIGKIREVTGNKVNHNVHLTQKNSRNVVNVSRIPISKTGLFAAVPSRCRSNSPHGDNSKHNTNIKVNNLTSVVSKTNEKDHNSEGEIFNKEYITKDILKQTQTLELVNNILHEIDNTHKDKKTLNAFLENKDSDGSYNYFDSSATGEIVTKLDKQNKTKESVSDVDKIDLIKTKAINLYDSLTYNHFSDSLAKANLDSTNNKLIKRQQSGEHKLDKSLNMILNCNQDQDNIQHSPYQQHAKLQQFGGKFKSNSIQLSNQDFSSIKFRKTDANTMNCSDTKQPMEHRLNPQNFIYTNLPSFTTTISNAFNIQNLLENENINLIESDENMKHKILYSHVFDGNPNAITNPEQNQRERLTHQNPSSRNNKISTFDLKFMPQNHEE